jgi:hypothetical protein
VYIVNADLDVKLAGEYLSLRGASSPIGGCPPDSAVERLYRQSILPEIVNQVNTAPEYADLRRIYESRILAEWYRTQRQTGGRFSSLINSGNAAR